MSWALSLGLLAATLGRASAAPDARELEAREDFAASRYDAALELFARLYAETLHPNYLRNIGRCYQNLAQPDHAITSFRDYLRKAKTISADERAEIDGYIKEMQDLKKEQESTGAARAPVTPLPAAAPPPTAATAGTPTASAALVASPAPAPGEGEATPIYGRWWFWAIAAGVVAAGVGVAAAAGAFTHTTDASCPSGYRCGGQ